MLRTSGGRCVFVVGIVSLFAIVAAAQTGRVFSGTVVTPKYETVPGVTIAVKTENGIFNATTDSEGKFSITVPDGDLHVVFTGKNLATVVRDFSPSEKVSGLQIKITYVVPPIVETVTIVADTLTPDIEYRNQSVYDNTLFGRDDQLIQSINAGISAGQHEGGGKSIEVRRFGFNNDHGGVGGGLKILVDDIPQNEGTQAHGQGYLGALKSLSPELVDGVTIINGPFSAAYGDFSGLGVVSIRQKESLPQVFTARIQGGSFNTIRGFFAYSPKWKNADSFIAYEPSYTDGPFKNPLRYRRDNVTANFTYKLSKDQAFGIKLNGGRNLFTSSGQIPLDLVARGELDRFGFIDPENGGRVRNGRVAAYYRKEFASGANFKINTFLARSLFDLFSNFTFFLSDPIYGDEIQQHDSRLQQGGNVQFLKPYKFFGTASLVTAGANLHFNQINVGLYPSIGRNPIRKFLPGNLGNANVLYTSAHAKVNNYAGYFQNTFNFFGGNVRVDAGLRFDVFTFDVSGFELGETREDLVGRDSNGKVQPKLAIAWSPFGKVPVSLYVNYGRGISSQDARGVVRNPNAPKISTTDFYQVGTSYNADRSAFVFSGFFIDRSREQVYIPDDGSIELAGASRSYGLEARTTIKLARGLSFNGGLTQVIRAFFPGQFTVDGRRVVVDRAPHTVANAGFVLADLRGFNASLNWRHISNYRLDSEDPDIRASGNDVVDLALSKRLKRWVDINFAIDNLLNKRYFETQNFFESRTCSTCDIVSRIHATPGYPFTVSIGLTFRIGIKN
ncbi:MAG: hypothetical protein C4324_00875 [Blastocatellia bacterium]